MKKIKLFFIGLLFLFSSLFCYGWNSVYYCPDDNCILYFTGETGWKSTQRGGYYYRIYNCGCCDMSWMIRENK